MSSGEFPCRFVPIFPSAAPEPLRVCAALFPNCVDTGIGANNAQLILLSSHSLGRSYLGALTDAGGRVQTWLELWVQWVGPTVGLDDGEAVTNPEIDARWLRWVQALATDLEAIITGYEFRPAPPVWLNLREGRAEVPFDTKSGKTYSLCTDDSSLSAAGLESFSGSRRRFLGVKNSPEAGFLAVLGAVPSGARDAAEKLPDGGAGLVAFNPAGGSLFIRRLAPLEWEQYRKFLSGTTILGVGAGRPPINLGGPFALLQDWNQLQQGGAYLFSTSRGRAGRFHETFHLKLLAWLSAVRAVRTRVAGTRLPQFNIRPESFRVDLGSNSGALPILWTARTVLVDPPAAVELPVPSEHKYFKAIGQSGPSVFLPPDAVRVVRSRGELRVRQVAIGPDGARVEATLVSPELVGASPSDLVWVKLPLPNSTTLDLVGKIDTVEALARGEALFRTGPLKCEAPSAEVLKRFEGAVFPSTVFTILPFLSTPVDLYSLGVMAVQLLLTGSGKSLASALDEVLSLARAVKGRPGANAKRVREVVAEDTRWLGLLGPQHHGHGASSADDASALLPQELWWDALALVWRFFPASSEDAFARDLGDAPPQRLDAAFDRPINELELLVLRSQTLLLSDWPSNREIARVIQKTR